MIQEYEIVQKGTGGPSCRAFNVSVADILKNMKVYKSGSKYFELNLKQSGIYISFRDKKAVYCGKSGYLHRRLNYDDHDKLVNVGHIFVYFTNYPASCEELMLSTYEFTWNMKDNKSYDGEHGFEVPEVRLTLNEVEELIKGVDISNLTNDINKLNIEDKLTSRRIVCVTGCIIMASLDAKRGNTVLHLGSIECKYCLKSICYGQSWSSHVISCYGNQYMIDDVKYVQKGNSNVVNSYVVTPIITTYVL